MATAASRLPTLDEFLEWERLQDDRHELVDGLVRAMTGGTADHNTIVLNFVATLRAALHAAGRDQTCRIFAENMKVIAAGAVLYPDVTVICAPVEPKADALTEPVLIVEVLSRSTHEIDRGRKWLAYQQIPSLRQYVLASQDEARVESYRRTEAGWSYVVIDGLEQVVELEPGALVAPLVELYRASSVAAGSPGAQGS